MPQPSKRKQAAKKRHRKDDGRFDRDTYTSIENIVEKSNQESDLHEATDGSDILDPADNLIDRTMKLPLAWRKKADSSIRGVYKKDSRTTAWRTRKGNEKAAQGSMKISTFWTLVDKAPPQQQKQKQEQK